MAGRTPTVCLVTPSDSLTPACELKLDTWVWLGVKTQRQHDEGLVWLPLDSKWGSSVS